MSRFKRRARFLPALQLRQRETRKKIQIRGLIRRTLRQPRRISKQPGIESFLCGGKSVGFSGCGSGRRGLGGFLSEARTAQNEEGKNETNDKNYSAGAEMGTASSK